MHAWPPLSRTIHWCSRSNKIEKMCLLKCDSTLRWCLPCIAQRGLNATSCVDKVLTLIKQCCTDRITGKGVGMICSYLCVSVRIAPYIYARAGSVDMCRYKTMCVLKSVPTCMLSLEMYAGALWCKYMYLSSYPSTYSYIYLHMSIHDYSSSFCAMAICPLSKKALLDTFMWSMTESWDKIEPPTKTLSGAAWSILRTGLPTLR